MLEACIEACEIVDDCVGDLLTAIDDVGGSAVITADHGNSDQLWSHEKMAPIQRIHSILLNSSFTVSHTESQFVESGALSDVAPTLLKLMDLPQPEAMSGHCLIR